MSSMPARGSAAHVTSCAALLEVRRDVLWAAKKIQAEYQRRGVELDLESCRKRVARQIYAHDVLPVDAASAMISGIGDCDRAGKPIGELYPE